MKSQLITILKSLGYPVFLQGSLLEDEPYPEAFFTFWNDETDDLRHYDNEPIAYVWQFSVNFYGTDPETVNSILLEAKELLKQNGWLVPGKGYDVPSDKKSHTGRGIDVRYIEREEKYGQDI